ncbi:hypothetical protein TNCV_2761641 [Trichonephila clavipes]|nr:hypothetical protein TNCV_2761641 [Trichonephila clavipes]
MHGIAEITLFKNFMKDLISTIWIGPRSYRISIPIEPTWKDLLLIPNIGHGSVDIRKCLQELDIGRAETDWFKTSQHSINNSIRQYLPTFEWVSFEITLSRCVSCFDAEHLSAVTVIHLDC